jgi:predicted dehydrogenase
MKHQSIERRKFLKQMTITGAIAAGTGMRQQSLAAGETSAPTTTGKKLRVGVIGCGNVAGSYVPDLKSNPDLLEIVSFCDIIPARAADFAKRFHVADFYPHVDRMLAGVPFDLLVNLTSMPSHHAVNKAGLQAGRHVWSEKPMAPTVTQGRELLDLAITNQLRFWQAPVVVITPQFRFMAEQLAGGTFGPAVAAHGNYGHGGADWSAWFYQQGGGSLYDLGVYNVTTLTGLLGPVREVVGMTGIVIPTRRCADKGEIKVEADDNTMLIMRHESGALSHVQTGFCYSEYELQPVNKEPVLPHTLDIMCTKGSLHLQGWDWGPRCVDVAFPGKRRLQSLCREHAPSWAGGASYAARCLVTGEKSLITPGHALHVLDVMNACHESQRSGRRIATETTFPWPIFPPK